MPAEPANPRTTTGPEEQQTLTARTHELFATQQRAFARHPYPALHERRAQLDGLRRALLAYEEPLATAISRDFGNRSVDETRIAELMPAVMGIRHTIRHLKRWMKPERRAVSVLFQPARNRVYYQPKGVVGIIVPWNYPLYLAIGPLTGALAAGNRVLIKLSEFTPETSRVTAEMLASVFPEDHVAVVTGDASVAADFSAQPFDHLFFTGSTTTGRLVMKAAADNLTPVTLELGGKSPAVISDDVPITQAAERIAFGKTLNAGQTCVAPDYALCPVDRVENFTAALRAVVNRLYPTLTNNADVTTIVNNKHYDRLLSMLADARDKGATVIEFGAAGAEPAGTADRTMPLTLVLDPTPDMRVMQEEIFGPILPVVVYNDLDSAIAYINNRPRPLALYYFGYNHGEKQRLLAGTHSGGVCFNDTLMQVAQDDLPFGGTGASGMGHYHGREGFLTFSHARASFQRGRLNPTRLVYPPYRRRLHRLVNRLFVR